MKASPAVLFLILKSEIWEQDEELDSLVGAKKGLAPKLIQLQAERAELLWQVRKASYSSDLMFIEFFWDPFCLVLD
jgi:hypothetical protein